jgi:hypothetical protein
MDEDDTTKTTSTTSSGPGYTPPARGCPGLATATDPNPASREATRLRCLNDWRRVAGLAPIS